MRQFVKPIVFALGVGLLAGPAVAQEKAASLDELLIKVQQGKVAESKENARREAAFRKAKSKQQSLLADAKKTRANEEARSAELDKTFDENELKVAAKQNQLNERLGELKELFGHLTSSAGDARENFNTSLVSAQYPNREVFLSQLIEKMNDSTQLPTIAEIEKLWFEIQREMTESGKVVKFKTTVIQPNGDQQEQDVVRVGTYNLISDGKYLSYTPESGNVSELKRQPESKFTSQAAALQSANSGLLAMGVDPTGPSGGSYLSALINSPTIEERWHQGGLVGYIISGLGAFSLLLALVRLLMLSLTSLKVSGQLKNPEPKDNNPLGRVLMVHKQNPNMDAETLELKMSEAILRERPSIEAGVGLLKIISMIAPLLGLLGTVTGMIITFQAITIFGAGDPKAMAGGISGALVTTVLGLVVAIPTVLFHTIVNGRARRILHVLEEQSTGIIAEHTEAQLGK